MSAGTRDMSPFWLKPPRRHHFQSGQSLYSSPPQCCGWVGVLASRPARVPRPAFGPAPNFSRARLRARIHGVETRHRSLRDGVKTMGGGFPPWVPGPLQPCPPLHKRAPDGAHGTGALTRPLRQNRFGPTLKTKIGPNRSVYIYTPPSAVSKEGPGRAGGRGGHKPRGRDDGPEGQVSGAPRLPPPLRAASAARASCCCQTAFQSMRRFRFQARFRMS